VYIAIIHTMADMGTLGASIRNVKLTTLGRQRLAHNAAVVEKMWEQIERAALNLRAGPGTVRVYQDGLPVCGREQEIVSELAEAGNRNHRLLLSLQDRGAILMGTESPELLVEEYRLVSAEYAAGPASPARMHRDRLSETLLEKRDRYIADRINKTLGVGERGILLLGMLHDVARYLDPNIKVSYPLGLPRLRQ
jgi:hypothetical protein